MKRDKKDGRKVFQSLTLVTQLGLNMIVSIGLACALGVWLDRKLGTSYITVILFILGVIAGGQSVYRMVQKIYGDGKETRGSGISDEDHRDTEKKG